MTALTQVIDPELQVDVVNLGLIYGIDIEGDKATIKMTLTIMGCPLSDYLEQHIQKLFFQLLELSLVTLSWSGIPSGRQSVFLVQLKSN